MSGKAFLSTLFEKHQTDLRRLIAARFSKVRHEAEDIVQDAFHNMLRVENIHELENPKAYLYQAAANLALNRIRKQSNHHQYIAGLGDLEVQEIDELTPDRTLFAHRDLKKLDAALARLSPKYQRTFLLSRVQDKTYKEIS